MKLYRAVFLLAFVGVVVDVGALQGKGHNKKRAATAHRNGFLKVFAGAAALSGATLQAEATSQDVGLSQMLDDSASLKLGFVSFLNEFGPRDYARVIDPCAEQKATEEQADDEVCSALPELKAIDGKEAELSRRFDIFRENVRVAAERMSMPGNKATHGVTKFMDYTDEEFERFFMGAKIDLNGEKEMEELQKMGFWAPEREMKAGGSRDWRDEGAVTPVKDQGQCGSCWAFSTAETIESAALVQGLTDKKNPFIGSPQEVVNCDHILGMGCMGGNPLFALQYFRFNGLEPESKLPYTSGTTGKMGKCSYKKEDGVFAVDGTSVVALMGIGEGNMAKHVLNEGPLSVAVYALPWKTYKSGIMTADQCRGKMDHAVQAVAINQDDPENPYWVIRNSWNTNWGEDGFIRLEFGKNTCSVAFMAVGAHVKKWEPAATSSTETSSTTTFPDSYKFWPF